jgi:hypothetical protein
MRYLKYWLLLALAVFLTACGGGGNPGSSSTTTTTTTATGVANALSFVSTSPSDKSIVLAGSGGNGRSESAILTFKVVDASNAAVSGAVVNFSVVPAGSVTLNITSATSGSSGLVSTTVSSKSTPTSVVVTATVNGKSISSQSDQLLVTTGVATQLGFDLAASKYSLNAGITGDTSTITVRIGDANGNPVADGVAVAFTTNFGVVGTSSAGGCLTSNGGCTVTYTVQDPRPADGQLITVVGSTVVGTGTVISDSLSFTATDPVNVTLLTADDGTGTVVTDLDMAGACTKTFTYFVGTPLGLAAPASTALVMTGLTTGLSATVLSGGTTGAALNHAPTPVTFTVVAPTNCNASGSNTQTPTNQGLQIQFTANSRVGTKTYNVKYPA